MFSAPMFFAPGIKRPAVRLYSFRCRYSAALLALIAGLFVAAPLAHAQGTGPQFVYYASRGIPQIFGFQLNQATGALTPIAGSPFNERFSPNAMAVNPAGTFLFVANGGNDNNVSVFSISQMTGALTEVATSPFATGLGVDPTVITTDQSGKYLYVGNQTGAMETTFGEIDAYTINPTTGVLTPTPNSTPPSLGTITRINPTGVYVHPNGRWIYFQDGFGGLENDNIIQGFVIQPTGDIAGFTSFQGISASQAMTGDPNGQFLINEWGDTCLNLQIIDISPVDGSLLGGPDWAALSSGLNLCEGAGGVTIDSTGNFVFMDFGSFSFSDGGLVVDQMPPGPTQSFRLGISLADRIGPYLFAESGHVYSINPATGAITDVPGSPFASAVGDLIAVTGYPTLIPTPGAQFSPNFIVFTNTTVGVPSAPQMIELVNTGTATLDISNFAITGTNKSDFMQTNTCAATLTAGANCVVTVIFTPSTTSAESASIQVTDSAAGSPQTAPLTGTGIVQTPPMPSLSPTSLTFPQTDTGSTSMLSFNISNSGTESLTISGIGIGGANPTDFRQTSTCGGTLGGLASCPVTVIFQPQAAGLRTGTATVSFGGGVSGPLAVMLSGEGAIAPPPFTVTPTGPTSASVMPGQPATYAASFMPVSTFSGTATLTCTVTPAGPGCSVSPAMVQVIASNNPTATPVKVTANASPAVNDRRHSGFPGGTGASGAAGIMQAAIRWPIFLYCVALLLLLAVAGKSQAANGSRRLQFSSIATVVAIAALCAVASCGGGGGSANPGQPQPQNFNVTLTATAGATVQTVNFTLTVQ